MKIDAPMRSHRIHLTIAAIVSALVTMRGSVAAQEPAASSASAPSPGSATTVQGSLDLGYRFRDVSGSMDSYRRFADLGSGPRLVGFDLFALTPSGAAPIDRLSISGAALGGDPFPSLDFSMRKTHRYDVRAMWRRSRFIDTPPITPGSIGGFDTSAVTDAHAWDSIRDAVSATGHIQVSRRLRVLFDVSHGRRSGTVATTRSLDYFREPSAWGSFARANPYPLTGPLQSRATDITAGVSYTRGSWVASYEAGYRTSRARTVFDALTAPERSINLTDATTAKESLTNLTWQQSEQTSAPVSRASAVYRPSTGLEWRHEYSVSGGHGPLDLQSAFAGVARRDAAGLSVAPYTLSIAASGARTQSAQLVGESLVYQLRPAIGLEAAYRYSHFRTDSSVLLDNAFTGAAVPSGRLTASHQEATAWTIGLHSLELRGVFTPLPRLSIRPGVVVAYRDVRMSEDSVINDGASRRQRDLWPVLDVTYRPSASLSIRGALHASTSDASYTRLSPTQRAGGRLSARWLPFAGWGLEASGSQLSAQLPDASYDSRTRTASATVWREISDRVRINAGLDWQSFRDNGATSFLRGAAPLSAIPLRNHEQDRIWRAGAVVTPTRRLELSSSLALNRITGTDAIDTEPPLYGPASYPYVTAAISYAAYRHGRFILDVQRLSLRQDSLPRSDFRSTILMVRYLRTF